MVEDHNSDISDFDKEAKSKSPEDVRALALNALPSLRKHLAMAEQIK